jgi:pyruvate carboxylase
MLHLHKTIVGGMAVSEIYVDLILINRFFVGYPSLQADESYQIGELGQFTPVGAYLAQDEIVKIAKEKGVSMIHPGYGFLSENAEFARKVEAAGMTFIGPSHDVIEKLGDKTKARTIGMIITLTWKKPVSESYLTRR